MGKSGEVAGMDKISQDGEVFFCGSQSNAVHALDGDKPLCRVTERSPATTGRPIPVEHARRMRRSVCGWCLKEIEADDG